MRLETSENDFEKGAKNEFQLEAVDVGAIQHVVVASDGKGLKSDWHLQQVLIWAHYCFKSSQAHISCTCWSLSITEPIE